MHGKEGCDARPQVKILKGLRFKREENLVVGFGRDGGSSRI